MKKVFKYQFPIDDKFRLMLPMKHEIIHVECQDGVPCLWAIVDPNIAREPVDFCIFGTGRIIEDTLYDQLWHHGTFQQDEFVWHLFQVVKED